jgi:hypothetical protein
MTREIATLVMLATVALLAGRDWRERAAALLWAFGIWDATYYVGLEILAQWPSSIVTPDVYFLLPVPWGGPVWVPLLADALMAVLAGWLIIGRRRLAGRAVQ